jgi:Trp operon repressor
MTNSTRITTRTLGTTMASRRVMTMVGTTIMMITRATATIMRRNFGRPAVAA